MFFFNFEESENLDTLSFLDLCLFDLFDIFFTLEEVSE